MPVDAPLGTAARKRWSSESPNRGSKCPSFRSKFNEWKKFWTSTSDTSSLFNLFMKKTFFRSIYHIVACVSYLFGTKRSSKWAEESTLVTRSTSVGPANTIMIIVCRRHHDHHRPWLSSSASSLWCVIFWRPGPLRWGCLENRRSHVPEMPGSITQQCQITRESKTASSLPGCTEPSVAMQIHERKTQKNVFSQKK